MARLWRNPKIKMGILIAGAALALVLLIVIMYYAICYRGPAKMDFDVRSKLTVFTLPSFTCSTPITRFTLHTPHSLHPRYSLCSLSHRHTSKQPGQDVHVYGTSISEGSHEGFVKPHVRFKMTTKVRAPPRLPACLPVRCRYV